MNYLPREGDAVSYIGEGVLFGAHGKLLATAGAHAGHVEWSTGSQAGQVTLVDTDDLVASRRSKPVVAARDELDDSLEVGGLSVTAVRQVQDEEGPVGVLNFMASNGHLSGFAHIGEQALGFVTGLVRQDSGVREVTAQLDDDEAEGLIHLAASVLLRDAFGVVDE